MLGHCIEMYIGDSEAYIGKSFTNVTLKVIESSERSLMSRKTGYHYLANLQSRVCFCLAICLGFVVVTFLWLNESGFTSNCR